MGASERRRGWPRDSASRRYVWGGSRRSATCRCPQRLTLLAQRAARSRRRIPGRTAGLTAVALDLETLPRAPASPTDAGPCRCDSCLAGYHAGRTPSDRAALSGSRPHGMGGSHLQRVLTRNPAGVRGARIPASRSRCSISISPRSSIARSGARSRRAACRPPTTASASYAAAGDALPAARAALDALGLAARAADRRPVAQALLAARHRRRGAIRRDQGPGLFHLHHVQSVARTRCVSRVPTPRRASQARLLARPRRRPIGHERDRPLRQRRAGSAHRRAAPRSACCT